MEIKMMLMRLIKVYKLEKTERTPENLTVMRFGVQSPRQGVYVRLVKRTAQTQAQQGPAWESTSLEPLLPTWIKFTPAWINDYINYIVWHEITYPFPLKYWNGWKCHPTLFWSCDYLSMLGSKSIRISKSDPIGLATSPRARFTNGFFHRNSNSMEISFHSHLNSNPVIATKFCTWHDSCAVVACAKTCCDPMANNGVMARRSCHRIWNAREQPLVKRATEPVWLIHMALSVARLLINGSAAAQ